MKSFEEEHKRPPTNKEKKPIAVTYTKFKNIDSDFELLEVEIVKTSKELEIIREDLKKVPH